MTVCHWHSVAKSCGGGMLEAAARAGEALIEQRDLCQTTRGGSTFSRWCEGNLTYSRPLALSYMKVAENWELVRGLTSNDKPLSIDASLKLIAESKREERGSCREEQEGIELPEGTRAIASEDAVFHWMVNFAFARRNLTPEEEKFLLGRKYTAEKSVSAGAPEGNQNAKKQSGENGLIVCDGDWKHKNPTRKRVASDAGVTEYEVDTSQRYANAIDSLDELGVIPRSDVLSGKVKIPASRRFCRF